MAIDARLLAVALSCVLARVGCDPSCDEPLATAEHETLPTAEQIRPLLPRVTLDDLTLHPNAPNGTASSIFQEHGVLIVRGLSAAYAPRINAAAEAAFARSVELMESGRIAPVQNEEHLVGWVTPDHTLFIPAPAGHVRDKQAMVLALDYLSDASMMQAASDPRLLDVLAAATGWDHIELFGKGQVHSTPPLATRPAARACSLARALSCALSASTRSPSRTPPPSGVSTPR